MKITVEHIHDRTDSRVLDMLRKINKKLKKVMAKQEQVDAAIASLTESAADISKDLNFLKDQIASGTVSDESISKLTSLAETFAAIGASTDSEETTETPVETEQPEEPTGDPA